MVETFNPSIELGPGEEELQAYPDPPIPDHRVLDDLLYYMRFLPNNEWRPEYRVWTRSHRELMDVFELQRKKALREDSIWNYRNWFKNKS
ncbi:hypothetical protein FRC02_007842 [Tulasnella sp. 418]|nr:hypothetical protein FRC02_007842 [Tulasnella sp. 418]